MRQARVPNLVALVGQVKAETFLRRALVQENVELEVEGQNETSRLAQKLALELVEQLKKPQWGLVNSIDAVTLYEAMNKRFGEAKEKAPLVPVPGIPDLPDLRSLDNRGGDLQKLQAQTYYLLGLIAQNRAKDAVAVAKKLGRQNEVYFPSEAMKALERAGYTKALDNFFYELLSQDAALPFWNDYVQIAAKAGQTERMVKLARSTATRDDLPAGKKVVIRQTLFRALLAAEEVEEGVKEIRRLIALEDSTPRSRREQSAGELGLVLARLGMLLQKPEWTEEGILVAQKSLEGTKQNETSGWDEQLLAPSLAGILLE